MISNDCFTNLIIYKMFQITQGDLRDSKNSVVGESQPKKQAQLNEVSISKLFRFAHQKDVILMVFGTLSAIALGTVLPLFSLLWGNLFQAFKQDEDMVKKAEQILIQISYLGLGALFVGWGMFSLWMTAGARQTTECRKFYMQSLIEQDIQWFDLQKQNELASQFAIDCQAFQSAVGEKVSTIIMVLSMLISGLIIAFSKGWLLALIILATMPIVFFGWYLVIRISTKKNKVEEEAYSEASGKMEECLSSIKTVKILNGEEHESNYYSKILGLAAKKLIKQTYFTGLGFGLSGLFLFISFVFSFWYGSLCVQSTFSCPSFLNGGSSYTAGNVITIFFSILLPALNMSQIIPSIQKIYEGRQAAARIYAIIDHQKKICSKLDAIIPETFLGVFEFEEVTFAYPQNKNKIVLDSLSCVIENTSCALVGQSGCGKSTIIQLMMRFYDPDSGRITLDGIDLRNLNLYWLRQQIGYVGQEPVLFATSIRQNMKMSKPDATDQEINKVLEQAEALNFVNSFPKKLDTFVGSGGSQISGGQKQRLAIARALLKNPKILLLDEATSSLDSNNERLIRQTISKIGQNRTMITIAHTLTTITECKRIYAVFNGVIQQYQHDSYLNGFKKKGNEFERDISPLHSPAEFAKSLSLYSRKRNNASRIGGKGREQQHKDRERSQFGQDANQIVEIVRKEDGQKRHTNFFLRLFSYAKDIKLIFIIGIISTLLNAACFPAFSVLLGRIISWLLLFKLDPAQMRDKIDKNILYLMLISIGYFAVTFLQQALLNNVGVNITIEIRKQVFAKILRMPIPWFEEQQNLSGKLTSRIQTDFKNVQNFCSSILIAIFFLFSNIVISISLAFFYEWRTALVALSLLPLICASGFIQLGFVSGTSSQSNKKADDSSQIVSETIQNIKTVLTLGHLEIIERYNKSLQSSYNDMLKKSILSGFFFGLSNAIMMITVALIFYLASIFTKENHLDVQDVFSTIFLVLFAGITAGNTIIYIPDTASSQDSANHLFEILDSLDEDQLQLLSFPDRLSPPILGQIQFQHVSYKYKSRESNILEDIGFKIKRGQKINFVGQSGCGKSTIIQLLLAFYKPDQGNIYLDGINLNNINIHHLRASIGVVSQQPVLFNGTVSYNIQYNSNATQAQIVQASHLANYEIYFDNLDEQNLTHQEITSNLKIKHDKMVGNKGSSISGGQKQRVAIARTIVRNPTILLLDEATSALDEQNEKAIQKSLDQIMQGKTTLNVTHRLYTIKNNQNVMVVEESQIKENGNFRKLMRDKGSFYELMQSTMIK